MTADRLVLFQAGKLRGYTSIAFRPGSMEKKLIFKDFFLQLAEFLS